MKIIRRDFLKTAIASAIAPDLTNTHKFLLGGGQASPSVHFPAAPRDRISVASYPFRAFISGAHDPHATSAKMPIKEFASHVKQKFNVSHIEPWSEHFISL